MNPRKIVSRRRRKVSPRLTRLIGRDAFIHLLYSTLKPRWERGVPAFCNVADNTYYLPSLEQIDRIVRRHLDDLPAYALERYDCDDFAWMLKGAFCKLAGERLGKPAGWAVGVIWTTADDTGRREGHAYNWAITKERELWLIEPQNGERWLWGTRHQAGDINYDRNITLVIG